MKYKVGDKVEFKYYGLWINGIIKLLPNSQIQKYTIETQNSLHFVTEKEIRTITYKTNRQWLESLRDKDYVKEIVKVKSIWQGQRRMGKTVLQFSQWLELWLQAEHKEKTNG